MKKPKYKITKTKILTVAIIVMIILLIIVINSCFGMNKHEKETFAYAEPIQESRLAEKPEGEFIDINELTENIAEENVIDGNIIDENVNVEEKKITNNINNTNNTAPYYIKVNYGAQVVNIYSKDAQGNYTVPVKSMVCSTGSATPKSGVYSIPARWQWLGLQGDVYGQYCTQITGNILFHSVPYLRRGDKSSLEYWEYDKLGTYASLGCIRLTVRDAKWIYDNCARGTKVEFYSSSDSGPLGKPSAMKISSYPDYLRNWDPTDPSQDNPWKTYKELENQNTTKNEVTNEVANEQNQENQTVNEQVNEIQNNQVNEQANEMQNNQVNEQANEMQNNQVNEQANETQNNQANEQLNETQNNQANEQPSKTENKQVNETAKQENE